MTTGKFDQLFEKFPSWGGWRPDYQLSTLNCITPDHIGAATNAGPYWPTSLTIATQLMDRIIRDLHSTTWCKPTILRTSQTIQGLQLFRFCPILVRYQYVLRFHVFRSRISIVVPNVLSSGRYAYLLSSPGIEHHFLSSRKGRPIGSQRVIPLPFISS